MTVHAKFLPYLAAHCYLRTRATFQTSNDLRERRKPADFSPNSYAATDAATSVIPRLARQYSSGHVFQTGLPHRPDKRHALYGTARQHAGNC